MILEQVSDLVYTSEFNGIDGMGEVASEGIRFLNRHFCTIVKEVHVIWKERKVSFLIDDRVYDHKYIERSLAGSGDSVEWKMRELKMIWKRQQTAESFHGECTEVLLREEYKNRVACICDTKNTDWEIDSIVPV